MDNVIVVAGATHRQGFLDEYERQLADAEIDFYLWPLEHLPAGANSITMRKRIAYMQAVADRFANYERIIMTDAWDVLFLGTRDDMQNVGAPLVVSAERNCYPEPQLADAIRAHTQWPLWRYANNGMLSGHPSSITNFCAEASGTGDLEILDQGWFNRRLAEGSSLFELDQLTNVFYVVSSTLEDGALMMKRGRPWNSQTGLFPCFFHFSGQCPDDRFRALLRGDLQML